MTGLADELEERHIVGIVSPGIKEIHPGADEDHLEWTISAFRSISHLYGGIGLGLTEVFTAPMPSVMQVLYPMPPTRDEMKERLRQVAVNEQRRLVFSFVERARHVEPDVQVWAKYGPDFIVSAVSAAHDDLDRELELHAIFIELARELDDPGAGDLIVRSPDELPHIEQSLGERVA